MTIEVFEFTGENGVVLTTIVRAHGPAELSALKQAMARAMNVWPDAPVCLKEFHDLLIHGEVLQKYSEMPILKRREELTSEENMKLDSWASENSEPGN